MLVCPTLIGILKFVKMKSTHNHCSRGKIKVFWRLSPDTCTYSLWTMVCQRLPLMNLFSVRKHPYPSQTFYLHRTKRPNLLFLLSWWHLKSMMRAWMTALCTEIPTNVGTTIWMSVRCAANQEKPDLILHATFTTVGKMVWHIQLV